MGINKLWSLGEGTFGYYDNQNFRYKEDLVFYNYLYTNTLKGNIHLYGFRCYNDNGSESASTTLAGQNVDLTNLTAGMKFRLRFGINTRLNAKPFKAKLLFRVRKANGTITSWSKVE